MQDINSIYHSATPEFRTHLNYSKHLSIIMEDLVIELSIAANSRLRPLPAVRNFLRLSSITAKSIESDMTFCKQDIEFSRVAAPWMPPKCYYRLYYLEAVLLYLINGDVSGFSPNGGHRNVRMRINNHLKQGGLIIRDNLRLSNVASLETFLDFHVTPGENVRNDFWRDERCTQAIMRKVAVYIKEDWARAKGYANFQRKIRQAERNDFLNKKEISIFDYFYQMRLKANYRDVDFLNLESAKANNVYEYITNYHKSYAAYASALSLLIRQLTHRVT